MKSKTALQIVIGLALTIPLIVGLQGFIGGVSRYNLPPGPEIVNLSSEFGFLSGAFLGFVPLGIWVLLNIETATWPFRLLTIAVFLGGLARVAEILTVGMPKTGLLVSMTVELSFPLLIIWQNAVAKSTTNSG